MDRKRKKSSGVQFYNIDKMEGHIGITLARRVQFPERNNPVDKTMDMVIMEAVQLFFVYIATTRQNIFTSRNWNIMFPIVIQCIMCGVLKGAEHHVVIPEPHLENVELTADNITYLVNNYYDVNADNNEQTKDTDATMARLAFKAILKNKN